MKYTNFTIFCLCIFNNVPLMFGSFNTSRVNFYLEEVRSLSELPLEKLIRLKSSFIKTAQNDYDLSLEGRSGLSMPLSKQLRRTNNNNYPIKRYDEWDDDYEKESKISKIFQLTVSALSFLAFGGYLLTLIIMAIRRNQANNNTTQASVLVLSAAQTLKRPKRGLFVYDPAENDYAIENLYKGMLMLSSDYSRHYR